MTTPGEQKELKDTALQNAKAILAARSRLDEELRRRSEWLSVTLASIADAVISTDHEGRVNFMNTVAETLTGWRGEEAIGRVITDVFRVLSEHTKQPLENPALRAVREGVPVSVAEQTLLIARDGAAHPIDESAAPVRSADGKVIGSVLIFRDVSARRRSEAVLAAIVETSDDAIISKSLDGIIRSWNRSAERLFGYSAAEAVGRHIDIIVPEELRHEERMILERLRRGERIDHFQTIRVAKNGRRLNISLSISPIKDASGKIIGASKVSRDVTASMRAQVDQAILAAIVETSDDAIVSKNLDGIIQSWNRSAERLYGYSADEAVGRHIDLIIPEELRDEERTILARLRRGDRVDHFETVRVTRDGRRLDISLSISPIKDPSGRIIGASKVARDITERKRAEREREVLLASERAARAEAERAGRMKDEFLATLSHELRTPLNAIVGWIHILRKKPPTPETLEQGLTVIDRNARVQSQLISDLLDMSRIISGKMRLDVQRVELPVVIEAALDAVRPAAEAKGIRIQSVLEPIVDPVNGDPARLQQVVWNLLSNAVKFTPRDGRVQLVLSRVNSHVELSVSDTGKGIAPEFLPHVFERFRQADSSTSREHGGLGLGLSIVRQLVELHGGTIAASSAGEGHGATFTVSLPLAIVHRRADGSPGVHPRASTLAAPAADTADLRGIRVLVVDDEADARDLIRRVLEESYAVVTTTTCAADAMQAAVTVRPHVILSDIGMPECDGYALMRDLRRAGIKAPAAALTAFARSEDRTRALQAGYTTHISKPIEPVELVAAVAALAHTSAEHSAPSAR